MGKSRTSSKAKRGLNKEKSKKAKSTWYDDSDHSTFLSDPDEVTYDDEYDNRDRIKGKMKVKADRRTFDDDHSKFSSDSDGSYSPPSRRVPKMQSFDDSDSDESDSSRFERKNSGRSKNGSGRNVSRRQSKNSETDSPNSDDSDNRSKFSMRIDQIRRDHEDSSVNSDTDSDDDYLSSGSTRMCYDKLRGSESNSKHLQQPQRYLSSRQQSMRSLGQKSPNPISSFHNQDQMQSPIPSRNNPQAMLSTSIRSMGSTGPSFLPGQQYQTSGVLLNQGQGQSQRLNRTSGQNVEGQTNPRFHIGPGHMMRSLSGRSINSYSSGQVQLHRASQNINMSPLQGSPNMMLDNSQRSLGFTCRTFNVGQGNALPSPSVYVQQPASMNKSVRSMGGNIETPMSSQMNRQHPGVIRGASNRTLGVNDGQHQNGMHPQQPELMRLVSQKSSVNNNSMINGNALDSQCPGLIRGSSQRSLGHNKALHNSSSLHVNPSVRMDTIGQSVPQTKNSHLAEMRIAPSSIPGEAVMMHPATLENTSAMSSKTSAMTSKISAVSSKSKSSKSRRSSPPETLADQISSRIRSRQGDTQSVGTFDDPPGEDSNRWGRKIDELYSEDSSYDSYRDHRKTYSDPPDKFDNAQVYSDVSGDESEPIKRKNDSFRSTDDHHDFYKEDDSHDSAFDEGFQQKYNVRVAKTTIHSDNYKRRSSASESSSGSFRCQKNGYRNSKASSRLASKLESEHNEQMDPPEIESSFRSERYVDSCKSDKDPKNHLDNVAAPAQQTSLGWLAQQISMRKAKDASTGSRSLEPQGASLNLIDSLSRDAVGRDADGAGCSNIYDILDDDDASRREDRSVSDDNSSLSSANNSVLRRKISDAVMASVKIGKRRSDNSTTTTDTMTQEVPLVIVGGEDDRHDFCTDSDSFLSASENESRPGTRDAYKHRKEKRSHPSIDTAGSKSSSKASRTARRRGKESVRDRIPRINDESSRFKNDTTKEQFVEEGSKRNNSRTTSKSSLQRKGHREERRENKERTSCGTSSASTVTKEPQAATGRLFLDSNRVEKRSEYRTSGRGNTRSSRIAGKSSATITRDLNARGDLDEIQSFEDQQSVMSLIDQLKSFELRA